MQHVLTKIVLALAASLFVVGCGTGVTYNLADLKQPIVMNSSPFVEGGESFNLIEEQVYRGKASQTVSSSGQYATTRTVNSAQINAAQCLGGRDDCAIIDIQIQVVDLNCLFAVGQGIAAEGQVVKIRRKQ